MVEAHQVKNPQVENPQVENSQVENTQVESSQRPKFEKSEQVEAVLVKAEKVKTRLKELQKKAVNIQVSVGDISRNKISHFKFVLGGILKSFWVDFDDEFKKQIIDKIEQSDERIKQEKDEILKWLNKKKEEIPTIEELEIFYKPSNKQNN